jgi:hypothetical protein
MLFCTGVLTVLAPRLWTDPFGPLVKSQCCKGIWLLQRIYGRCLLAPSPSGRGPG